MIRIILIMLLSFNVFADSSSLGLQLPSMANSYQSDKFRAGNLDCSNAIGGSANFEFGMTGIVNNATSPFSSEDDNNPTTKDVGVYARITMPLNAPKERINCNTLYKLELRKKRLEVMRLEQELNNLRRLQLKNKFEN